MLIHQEKPEVNHHTITKNKSERGRRLTQITREVLIWLCENANLEKNRQKYYRIGRRGVLSLSTIFVSIKWTQINLMLWVKNQ